MSIDTQEYKWGNSKKVLPHVGLGVKGWGLLGDISGLNLENKRKKKEGGGAKTLNIKLFIMRSRLS